MKTRIHKLLNRLTCYLAMTAFVCAVGFEVMTSRAADRQSKVTVSSQQLVASLSAALEERDGDSDQLCSGTFPAPGFMQSFAPSYASRVHRSVLLTYSPQLKVPLFIAMRALRI